MVKSKALRRWLDHTHDQRRANLVRRKICSRCGQEFEKWVDERLAHNPKAFIDDWFNGWKRNCRGKDDAGHRRARSREEVSKMLRNFEEEEE